MTSAHLPLAFLALARATFGLSYYVWQWGGSTGDGCDDVCGMGCVMAAYWALATLATLVLRHVAMDADTGTPP